MPRVTIWIREEDYDNWQSIDDKPTFIHNAIAVRDSYLNLDDNERTKIKGKLNAIAHSENIKTNSDGTLSPIDPGKPSSITTRPIKRRERDMGFDPEDKKPHYDDEPDWGA